jgi:hypothetical protein
MRRAASRSDLHRPESDMQVSRLGVFKPTPSFTSSRCVPLVSTSSRLKGLGQLAGLECRVLSIEAEPDGWRRGKTLDPAPVKPAFEDRRVSKQGLAAIGNGPILERRLRAETYPGRWNPAIQVDRTFLDGRARLQSHLPHLAVSANLVEFCVIRIGRYQHGTIGCGRSDRPCPDLL